MSEEKRIVDYCSPCKEYKSLLVGYLDCLATEGDYNSWQGLGLLFRNASEDSAKMDEEILEKIRPTCEKCEAGPGIYVGSEKLLKLSEWWEDVDKELSDKLSHEKIKEYIQSYFLIMTYKTFLDFMTKELKEIPDDYENKEKMKAILEHLKTEFEKKGF